MNSQERGDRTESRALKALEALKVQYPSMVRKVRRASPETDARGVDFFIELSVRTGRKRRWMTVPIEVKSSIFGIRKWRVTHPDHYKAGVIHFFIPDWMHRDEICWLLILRLERLRYSSKNGRFFVSWFKKLHQGRMSPRGQENVRKIRERRQRHSR